jgi:NAD(P)-dependent dehydrogenase (short-subunit alcohol dehydrogenase family)
MNPARTLNPSTLFSARDLTIVITGGATGLGLAMTAAAFQTGASKIYILGRRLDALTTAARAVDPDQTGVVVPLQCDVADAAQVQEAVARIAAEARHVDVLVNNAGVGGPNQIRVYEARGVEEVSEALLEADVDEWERTWAINATAPVKVSAAFLGLLEAANVRKGWESGKMEKGGRARRREVPNGGDAEDVRMAQIVNIASIAAYNRQITLGLPYIGSKAAVVAMGKSLSNLLGPFGIRVNTICPGCKY